VNVTARQRVVDVLRSLMKPTPGTLAGVSLLIAVGMATLNAGPRNGPVVIGAVYNLHGYQANLDIPSAQGAQLAVDEIDGGGGLLGRAVQLAIVDGLSKPTVIARKTFPLFKRFPDMPAVMGLSDTDMVLAAAPVAASAGRLFLTSGATSPRLPDQVPGALFLACFGDNVQAAAAAESAYFDLGSRTAGVLYAADNTYTELLQHYFAERFTSLGGIVGPVRSYQPGEVDGLAAGLDGLDMVFVATGSADESLAIIEALRAAGITAPIVGGDSYDSEQLWQQHPDVADVYFTTHAYLGAGNPDPAVQAFRAAYLAAYGVSPDAFAALGYDTARLLASAIAAAGSTDPTLVREALAGIRDFTGVTGRMHYPPGSRIPVKTVTILRISNGALELFRQLEPSEVPLP
jgi:branched-chain amino acid transport system substrate-binding protein